MVDGTSEGVGSGSGGSAAGDGESPVTIEDIRSAAKQLAGVAHRTPVLTSATLDERVGARIFAKAENFQRVGAFKFRGAYNTISRLPDEQLAKGVVAYSSGNHAQAVALSARLLGTSAVILMPADTPATKRAATEQYGAEVVTYDRYTQDRTAIGNALAAERGLALVPPYDHPQVIAGQGTAALELLDEVGELDALIVPVGGGGLMAGTAIAAKALHPNIRVIGVEPTGGDDTKRSLAAGERIQIPVPHTIADAQAAEIPGELTFSINRRLVDEIVLVDDAELVEGLRFGFERMKVVAEPTGIGPITALLTEKVSLPGQRVGVVISGGNIGADRFATLLAG